MFIHITVARKWEVNFLVELYPQCTLYIYILIYNIKGPKFLQIAVYMCVYIYIYV